MRKSRNLKSRSENQRDFLPTRQIGVGGLELGPKEKAYLSRVIRSNRLSYGPFSQKFEALFARLHDCQFAVFCSSGTSALHLAVAALKEASSWQDGDEIIVPATTFIATSNVVLHNRLKPVFVDVDARTYNMDSKLIEEKITTRTRALMPVHLMGLPCDMDPICEIATRHRLRIIEDSCETMFASYRGRKVGSMGDIGCFSTYIAHFIVAGIGGLAITNDRALAEIMRSMMNHGRDTIYTNIDDDQGVPSEKLREIVAKRFSFVRLGFNFRATEMEAAIGLAQLEYKDQIIRARRKNAQLFMRKLEDLKDYIQLPVIPPDRDHMFMLFPIVVKKGSKQELVDFLEENMIETRDLFPLLNQPAYRRIFGKLEGQFPVSQWLAQNGFYIGCHQYLTNEEKEYVVGRFHEYFRTNKDRSR